MRARSTLLLVALLGAAFPSSAAAQRCTGEDVAAIHQYCEMVPGAEGAVPTSGQKQTLRKTLPRAARMRLEREGPEGRALLAMPLGAPLRRNNLRLDRMPGALAALRGTLGEHAGGVHGAVRTIETVAGGKGLSEAFRWALLISTLALAAAAWARQRG